jgi:FkbM family methyltransferase
MNDLRRDGIKRFLQGLGTVVRSSNYYRYPYDRENFPRLEPVSEPTIFDVGANIGQSSVWFSKTFPRARIHAFEPVAAVFATLEANTKKLGNVKCIHGALGARAESISIPRVSSASIQTTQVLADFGDASAEAYEEIAVLTADDYCDANGIDRIDVLKTDTEGFDLEVARGAKRLLEAGAISYFIAEVTIARDDAQHTNFFELREFVNQSGYEVTSFFDLVHAPGRQLHFFNALFERTG